jgi:hypothetical protein
MGKAHAAKIRYDDGAAVREILRKRNPHIAGLAVAVQQNDGRSRTSDADV